MQVAACGLKPAPAEGLPPETHASTVVERAAGRRLLASSLASEALLLLPANHLKIRVLCCRP